MSRDIYFQRLLEASAGEGGAGYRTSEGLRPDVQPVELAIDPRTGMKNYIANTPEVGAINPTSAEYVQKQLIRCHCVWKAGRRGSVYSPQYGVAYT
jgi:hypothetical protein